MLDELDFVSAERRGDRHTTARSYLDFGINRRPLRSIIETGDRIGVFGWLERKAETRYARQLLLREPSELPSGRVPLYICPECADLGCGVVSARVIEDQASFAWAELAIEDPNGGYGQPFDDVRVYYFAKAEYERAIRRFWPR